MPLTDEDLTRADDISRVPRPIQIHHQRVADLRDTRLIAQRHFVMNPADDFREWVGEIQECHPLPNEQEWQWMACDEHFDGFVKGIVSPYEVAS
jgi:hypothetical protein